MATPSTRQAIVQAILKRRNNESFHREKKSMKGYVPSYLEGDEKCVVCGDKATGYHYKCITCEGCKGFFRRTVQKSLESSYQCKHSSNCDINKVTRNQCQLCRYKKCIGVGMAKDLVLDEDKRLAKRKLIEQNRELRRHKELSQMMAQCGWRIERPTDDERRLIHDVTQAYFQANDIQNKTTSSTCNGLAVAERFSTALTAAITNVVDFAKRIPLFVNHVSTEDQVLILKVCCMEVITLRCVTSYKNSTKKVTLFPTVDVTRDQLRFTRLEPFSDSLFALAEHLNSMDLTPVEIALLQASLIFSGDRPGIAERIRLDHAQNIILRAFEHHLNELWPHDPKYCPSLMMKLTDVRTVSACLADTLMSMRMDDPQELGRLFYPAETAPAMPIPYPHINLHQPFKSPSMPDKCSQSFFHSSGKHRAVVKSFSLPHLNGIKTVHQNVHNFGPSGRANSLTYGNFNRKSRLQELVDKRPDQVSPEHNHILLSSGLPSTSALPAQLFPPDSEHHPPANNEICRLSSKRNGIRLSTGNGVKYNPLSSECVKYETYRNSHNKVFERMTKATRTSSSLSDDTNLISRFDLNNPIHFDNGHSHSVPSSPNKGSETYQRPHHTPEISKHRRLDMAPQEYRYSCPVQQFRTVPRQVSTTVDDSNDIRLAGTCFFIGVDEASDGDHRRANNGHYENEILMKSSQANTPTALSCFTEDKSRDFAQQCAESQTSLSGSSPFFELFRVQPAGCRGNNGTELPTSLSAQSQSETDKMTAFHDKLEPNKGHQNKSKRPISSPTFPSRKVKCVNRNCDESEHNRANTTHISTTNSYGGNGIIMRPVITTNADGSHFGIPLQKRPKSC